MRKERNELNIPMLELGKFRFSPPGPMGANIDEQELIQRMEAEQAEVEKRMQRLHQEEFVQFGWTIEEQPTTFKETEESHVSSKEESLIEGEVEEAEIDRRQVEKLKKAILRNKVLYPPGKKQKTKRNKSKRAKKPQQNPILDLTIEVEEEILIDKFEELKYQILRPTSTFAYEEELFVGEEFLLEEEGEELLMEDVFFENIQISEEVYTKEKPLDEEKPVLLEESSMIEEIGLLPTDPGESSKQLMGEDVEMIDFFEEDSQDTTEEVDEMVVSRQEGLLQDEFETEVDAEHTTSKSNIPLFEIEEPKPVYETKPHNELQGVMYEESMSAIDGADGISTLYIGPSFPIEITEFIESFEDLGVGESLNTFDEDILLYIEETIFKQNDQKEQASLSNEVLQIEDLFVEELKDTVEAMPLEQEWTFQNEIGLNEGALIVDEVVFTEESPFSVEETILVNELVREAEVVFQQNLSEMEQKQESKEKQEKKVKKVKTAGTFNLPKAPWLGETIKKPKK